METVFVHDFGTEILRVEVGSTAHGVGTGSDDLDLSAVIIPTKERALGLRQPDIKVHRTAVARTGNPGARSEPGDLDLTLYPAKEFAKLACKGNPSILVMLFSPIVHATPEGLALRRTAALYRSKEAGFRFLGYMRAQKQRLAGERGQKRVNRPELVEKYGYDCKYAYHILRLGLQGLEFVSTGKITIPMTEFHADFLLAVRRGRYRLDQILQWASELEEKLTKASESSDLPAKADPEPIDKMLVSLHESVWNNKRA